MMFARDVSIYLMLVDIAVAGSTYLILKPKDEVVMKCPFKSFSPPIIWLGPVGRKLRTYSDGVNINRNIPNYDRIRTTGNHEKGEYNLKILNLTLEDAGQYKCHSFKNGSVLQAVYLLNILDKPKTPDDNRSFHFKAVIGKPAEAVVPVISLTEPVVSWTQNAGGRLGPWTAVKNGSSQSLLHSTISSTIKTHIGIYGIKVRNDVGSIDLQLELHLTDFPVTLVPENAYCNASTKLTLSCQLHFNDDKDWQSKWIHSRNRQFIKDIVGIVDFNTSTVDIKFCDYREEGEYECIWKSPFKEYSASSTVKSNGPPTLTGTECLIENFNICMAVRFYSADRDITVHWFRNDVEMEISERFQVILFPTIVQLNYTKIQIQEEGYTSKLCISDMTLRDVEPYSCQIVNNYGSIEYSFKKDDINQIYQHLSDVLSTMVTDVYGEPDQNEEEQDNIIIIGIPKFVLFGAAFVIVVISVLVAVFCLHKRCAGLMDKTQMIIVYRNQSTRRLVLSTWQTMKKIGQMTEIQNQWTVFLKTLVASVTQ